MDLINISISNVVASARLGHKIDLHSIVRAFPHTDYRPKRFPGLVFRTKRPKTTILIFRTDKFVCTGAKSEKDAKRVLRRVVRNLRKKGIAIQGRLKIEIQNIVASITLGARIDLVKFYEIARKIGLGNSSVMYEPEMFPALIYRANNPHTVILIFASGKLVCTGTKKEEEVYQAVNTLWKELNETNVLIKSHFSMNILPRF